MSEPTTYIDEMKKYIVRNSVLTRMYLDTLSNEEIVTTYNKCVANRGNRSALDSKTFFIPGD